MLQNFQYGKENTVYMSTIRNICVYVYMYISKTSLDLKFILVGKTKHNYENIFLS